MDTLIHGFQIIRKTNLPELDATGILARHKKTGAEVYHLLTDDSENLFCFGFPTFAHDSKGVAHAVLHCIASGSKRYPISDPLSQLMQQSVKTYLNAHVYSNRTLYTSSSLVKEDYFNLMAVYGDVVFFPLLKREDFHRQIWRFELDEHDTVRLRGLLLNIMRGEYSNFDAVCQQYEIASLCREAPCSFDTKGAPDRIPDLTFEEVCAYYEQHYHPRNCKIFLSGNIKTDEQLKFLNEQFLRYFDAGRTSLPLLESVLPYTEPNYLKFTGPANTAKDAVFLTWLLPESKKMIEAMEAVLLAEILVGHDGSPLRQVIIESGIAEDMYAATGARVTHFYSMMTIGVRGLKVKSPERFKDIVFKALYDIVARGLGEQTIAAAIHKVDFQNRHLERYRNSGPPAMELMENAYIGWMYGEAPERTMRRTAALEGIKQRIATDKYYVEKLIQEYLLENDHHSLVLVCPCSNFLHRINDNFAKRAAAYQASLSDDDYKQLREQREQRNKVKNSETQTVLPCIKKEQLLPPVLEPIQSLMKINNIPCLVHEQRTNGIGYIRFAFPVDVVTDAESEYLPLLCACLKGMGTKDSPWNTTSTKISSLFGHISIQLLAFSKMLRPDISMLQEAPIVPPEQIFGRRWLEVSVGILDELICDGIPFLVNLLRFPDFFAKKRLTDIVIQLKNDFENRFLLKGHAAAKMRALSGMSSALSFSEKWNGIRQLLFLRELSARIQDPYSLTQLAETLTRIHKKILNAGVILNLSGTKKILRVLENSFAGIDDALLPLSSSPAIQTEPVYNTYESRLEVVSTDVAIGHLAVALRGAPCGTRQQAIESVLGNYLTRGPLWDRIRVKGGTFGLYFLPQILDGITVFAAYHDLFPLSSVLEYFYALENIMNTHFSKADIDRLIIGQYGQETAPQVPIAQAGQVFHSFLSGYSTMQKTQHINWMLETDEKSFCAAARDLLLQRKSVSVVAVGNDHLDPAHIIDKIHFDTVERLKI